jgi:DNA-binding NarL/FixJ family response regulator
MKRITVLLADDNRVVRKEFRRILELEPDLEVVGEAKNGCEAVAMVKKRRPALVLMDVTMPLLNGLQATCQILKTVPSTKVLILSAYSDEAYVIEAVKSGAMGYLIKQTSADTVCSAIRAVQNGGTFYSSSIPSRLHKRNRKQPIVNGRCGKKGAGRTDLTNGRAAARIQRSNAGGRVNLAQLLIG